MLIFPSRPGFSRFHPFPSCLFPAAAKWCVHPQQRLLSSCPWHSSHRQRLSKKPAAVLTGASKPRSATQMQPLRRAWQGASRRCYGYTPQPTWKHALIAVFPIAALLWNGYSYTIRGSHASPQTPTGVGAPPNQHSPSGPGGASVSPPLPVTTVGAASTNDVTPRGPGIVRLNFMGRLGNNLFEYAAARTLADGLGWALSIQPARYNPQKFGLLTRPEGMACFPGVRPLGAPHFSPEMAGLEATTFRGMRRELRDPSPRSIVMEGWFQEYALFSSEKERLRKVSKPPACLGACCRRNIKHICRRRDRDGVLGQSDGISCPIFFSALPALRTFFYGGVLLRCWLSRTGGCEPPLLAAGAACGG